MAKQKPDLAEPAAEERLAGFLAKFTPEIAAFAQASLFRMRARLPGAMELVYDNYNALAIGFGPTERSSDAVFSIAVFPRWVSLFFLKGKGLPDPDGLLQGKGNVVSHIVLKAPAEIDSPPIQALIVLALEAAGFAPGAGPAGRLVIKSVPAKQRPRRPARPA